MGQDPKEDDDGAIDQADAGSVAPANGQEEAAGEDLTGAPSDVEEEPEASPAAADAPEGLTEESHDGPQGPDAAPVPEGPTMEDLELKVAALRQRLAEYKDKVLRGAADLENLRRRSGKELEEAKKYGIDRVLKDLLPVLDNFERALSHGSEEGADPQAFLDGLQMVLGQFKGGLERHGVTPFDALGEKFDPNLHEAIHRKETDEAPPGTVVEEFQRGFMIHDRLARPAMVIVATKPAEPAVDVDEDVDVEVEAVVEAKVEAEVEAEVEGPPDVSGLGGEVDVIGATIADATGEILDAVGAAYGAVLTQVQGPSPAGRAGLQVGDVVTHVGHRQIMDARSLKRAVQQSLPKKQSFTIVYRRVGETLETKIGGR